MDVCGFPLLGALADSTDMETPRALSIALHFGVALIFFLLLLQRRLHVQTQYRMETAFIAGLLFLLYYGTHLLIKTLYPEFPLRLLWFEYIGYFILFCLFPFVSAVLANREDVLEKSFWLLTILTFTTICLYLSSYSADAFLNMRYRPFQSVNATVVGSTGLLGAILAAWGLFLRKSVFVCRIVFGPMILGGIALAMLSGQRQVFVSLVVITVLFLYRVPGKSGLEKAIRRFLFICVTGLLALAISHTDKFDNTLTRIQGTAEQFEGYNQDRIEPWTEALTTFLDQPLFGGPIELPSTGAYPHNLVLEAFMVTGMFGGSIFCIFVLIVAKLAFRVFRISNFGWIALFHYQTAISAQVSGSLYISNLYWISSGLVICAYRLISFDSTICHAYMRRP